MAKTNTTIIARANSIVSAYQPNDAMSLKAGNSLSFGSRDIHDASDLSLANIIEQPSPKPTNIVSTEEHKKKKKKSPSFDMA